MNGPTKVVSRMFKSKLPILLCMLIALCSCKGQKGNTSNHTLEMVLLLEDSYGGQEKEQLLVIKDDKSLKEYFGVLNRTRKPGLPVPQIDFKKEMVIAWSPGVKSKKSRLILQNYDDQKIIFKKDFGQKKQSTAFVKPVYFYKVPLSDRIIEIE